MSNVLKAIKKRLKKISFIYEPYRMIANKKLFIRRNKALKEYGYDMIGEVSEIMSQSGVKCFCAYGTLLGIIREGQFIQYDNDIDMVVIDELGSSWTRIEKLMAQNGYEKVRYFTYDDLETLQTYEKNGLTIDFFRYYYEGDHLFSIGYRKFHDRRYIDEKYMTCYKCVFPLLDGITTKSVNNKKVNVPKNYRAYLEAWYGTEWETPIKNYENKVFDFLPHEGIFHHK